MDFSPYIENLRDQIAYSLRHDEYGIKDLWMRDIDDFLLKKNVSELEKAFFLVLNQFPRDHTDYLIRPGEMVLVRDIYDLRVPGIDYELDFAIYGGSINDPVKVAIEVDGQRSHGEKHVRKDRRKDANLQAAGWLVMRFSSKEIHQEIVKFSENENHVSDFLTCIDNVIREKLQLVTGNNYGRREIRTLLTGYSWGQVTCPDCGRSAEGILNRKKQSCNHCGHQYLRVLGTHERVKYEHQGLWYFESDQFKF
ncbi:DUF559 domain-containing protein [Pedobacter sp. D749]|uniref:DUF559 domain-containing protein n=1 Tax=Pedobacter sp. D749 TaxID=2856523 RepID=UPI001C58297B|nr:DUF559 domain-containing protein [Pedobacter sp. D749]QXU43470.1 DUF559 domain-containing protein [Pedobacter sp. D749]